MRKSASCLKSDEFTAPFWAKSGKHQNLIPFYLLVDYQGNYRADLVEGLNQARFNRERTQAIAGSHAEYEGRMALLYMLANGLRPALPRHPF